MKFDSLTYWTVISLRVTLKKTMKYIAETTGLGFYTVRAIIRRFRSSGTPFPYQIKTNLGTKRISLELIYHISQLQKENKTWSLSQIQRALMQRDIILCKSTIHKYRHQLGFRKRKLLSIPFLTPAHILKRSRWCGEMMDKNWNMLTFTDESVFEINYRNQNVWYQDSTDLEELHSTYFQKNEKVMIAGVISARGKSSLKMWRVTNKDYRLDERVNAAVYRQFLEEIEGDVAEMFPDHNVNLVLDNAKPHLAVAKKFLQESPHIQGNYQPPNSPDIQPCEMVWNWLKKRVYSQSFNDMDELIQLIQDAWQEIPVDLIKKFINHCKNRCRAVYEADGRWPLR